MQEWDIGIIREVILADCYDLLGLRGREVEPRLVVDVGAHLGAFSAWAKFQWPNAKVISVEATFTNFLLLEENMAGLADVHCRHAALVGEADRPQARMHGFRLSAVSPTNTGGSRLARPGELYDEVVPALAWDDLLHQHDVECIDLLKLDCEGSELGLLRAATASGLVSRIRLIRGEWHGRAARDAIEQLLGPTHDFTSTVASGEPELGMFFAELRGA